METRFSITVEHTPRQKGPLVLMFFSRMYEIPSITFDKLAASDFAHLLKSKMFKNLASMGGGIGKTLQGKSQLTLSKITAVKALASVAVMGDDAMLRLEVIKEPRSNTVRPVGAGDGMCITLEALVKGSLLAISQGLPSTVALHYKWGIISRLDLFKWVDGRIKRRHRL